MFGATYTGDRNKGDRYQSGVTALAALAYDATNLLLQAIKDVNADDTAKVSVALANISFSGVTGRLTFDGNHNPIKTAVVLSVRNKKVVFDSVVDP